MAYSGTSCRIYTLSWQLTDRVEKWITVLSHGVAQGLDNIVYFPRYANLTTATFQLNISIP